MPGTGAALPRAERLRAGAEIERIFRRGRRREESGFVLLWVPVPGRRAAVFTAGRRLGGSVERNRARRRLREAYRRKKGVLPAEGVRLCLVARPRAVAMPFDELTAEVQRALGHAARGLASWNGDV